MRLFSSFAILMIIARSLGLCCFAEWAKIPHEHIVLGNVMPEELAHHHDPPQMTDHMPLSPTPTIHGGIVLSVSFGEWQNLLSDFYLLAFPRDQRFLIHLLWIARIANPNPPAWQHLLRKIDPPPRLIYI